MEHVSVLDADLCGENNMINLLGGQNYEKRYASQKNKEPFKRNHIT